MFTKTIICFVIVFCSFVFPAFAQKDLLDMRQQLDKKNKTFSTEKTLELLNVSYDPTREFYEAYNTLFHQWWQKKTGQDVSIIQSHGGSGKQARSVISGLEADVVSLAIAFDIDAIEKITHAVGEDWQKRLPNNSCPYFSTIVFLVRRGNPKGIKDWGDLIQKDVTIVMPNPKTSGGARWAYMAAWGWALANNGGNQEKAKLYLQKLFAQAPVLDAGARASTTTFIQRMMGDVLITWENEAYMTIERMGHGDYEIVYPSLSIRTEPPVTWLDKYVEEKGTREAAEFYLKYLYSVEGQELIAQKYFRPYDLEVAKKYKEKFPDIKMVKIEDFGGWEKTQEIHFKDQGIFDQVFLREET